MKPRREDLIVQLEGLYRRYNHRVYLDTDPVQFVHRFRSPADRELVGLIAAHLAYGQVKSIHASIERVLERLGPHPAQRVREMSLRELQEAMAGFVHRWTRGEAMARFLFGAGEVCRAHGSLGAAFSRAWAENPGQSRQALVAWSCLFRGADPKEVGRSLMARPENNSACKRLHLYLRWMVRRDEIDPGPWEGLPLSCLLLPVDVHMHRIGRWLGFTHRKAADVKTVEEITRGFRRLCPEDPCRYDFALTRLGMAGVSTRRDMFERLKVQGLFPDPGNLSPDL